MERILVIEDHDDVARVMGESLEAAGFDVVLAHDGIEGLERQRSLPADLVITDIFMPQADGLETIATLKSEFPDVRIIAMSGASRMNADYLRLAREVGACDTLPKPFDLDDMVARVQRALGESRSSRRMHS